MVRLTKKHVRKLYLGGILNYESVPEEFLILLDNNPKYHKNLNYIKYT